MKKNWWIFWKTVLLNKRQGYWDGKLDEWKACENMVCERIKKHYPLKYKQMWEELLQ